MFVFIWGAGELEKMFNPFSVRGGFERVMKKIEGE